MPTFCSRSQAPRLAALAALINAAGRGWTATISAGFCNTDRYLRGSRLRHPGKGRKGNRLIVRDQRGQILLDHNGAETYRHNGEVVEWMRARGLPLTPDTDAKNVPIPS